MLWIIAIGCVAALSVERATLAVRTISLRRGCETCVTWAEVGILAIHFDQPPVIRLVDSHNGDGTPRSCSLGDFQCQPEGMLRLTCGRRVLESFAHMSTTETFLMSLRKKTRLGPLDVLVPMSCTSCDPPHCEVCDWAATQSAHSAERYPGETGWVSNSAAPTVYEFIQRGSASWIPSNSTLTMAFLLSLNGEDSGETVFPCKVKVLHSSEQGTAFPVELSCSNVSGCTLHQKLFSPVEVHVLQHSSPPLRGSAPDERKRDKLRNPARVSEQRLVLLEEETLGMAEDQGARAGMDPLVASFFAPVAGTGPMLIAQQVADAIVQPIKDLVMNGVVNSISEMLMEMVTNREWVKVLNEITDEVVLETTKYTSKQLGKFVQKNLNSKKRVSQVIASRVSQRVVERVLPSATSITAIGTANEVSRVMVPILLRGLGHSLVGSLVSSISNSPLQDYYCYYCATHKIYCKYCQRSASQAYYALYYAGYYSTFYALAHQGDKDTMVSVEKRREEDHMWYNSESGRGLGRALRTPHVSGWYNQDAKAVKPAG
mmetsp:Transcript_14120/g.27765  ORF Transcript_14120/g.27765 Transcript_14120/m.27765 type:complete len:544 (-) Transcript_14120:206-1837(-)